MEFNTDNEHLVPTPEGFELGDLIEVTRDVDRPTGLKATQWIGTVLEIVPDLDNNIHSMQVLPNNAQETLTVLPTEAKLISRPINIATISDEALEAQIDRLHTLAYIPPEPKQRRAKQSSVRATTKKRTTLDTAKRAVKTGKVTGNDLDNLLEILEKKTKQGD